jgi:hypothetical protein
LHHWLCLEPLITLRTRAPPLPSLRTRWHSRATAEYRRTLRSHVASLVWVFPEWTIALGSTLVSPRSSYSILTNLVAPPLTRTSLLVLQFGCSHREVVLVHPWSPNRCPSFHVVDLVSIGLLAKCRWVSGGRRGGSVPVGAAP